MGTALGKDYTLFALSEGIVEFKKSKYSKRVSSRLRPAPMVLRNAPACSMFLSCVLLLMSKGHKSLPQPGKGCTKRPHCSMTLQPVCTLLLMLEAGGPAFR